ncbi:MAG: hypothetical protein HC831_13615 [Chloroflexia bacterium]|nr:hypothetical protein [Chloroflexia bacterium]
MINKVKTEISKHTYTILFLAIFLVYIFNLFIDVMEVDAAQYALISMEMSWTKAFCMYTSKGMIIWTNHHYFFGFLRYQ